MTPRKVEQNQMIRDERRDQLLAASLRVFAERGFTGTKVSDIAAAAKLSHGLVYHYFQSKDEIFYVLTENALHRSFYVVELALQQPGSPWDRLHWLAETILQYGGGEAAYYFLIMLQALTSNAIPESVKQLVQGSSHNNIQALRPLIVKGQEAGQIVEGDPDTLSVLFFSTLQGIVLLRLIEHASIPLPTASQVLRALRASSKG